MDLALKVLELEKRVAELEKAQPRKFVSTDSDGNIYGDKSKSNLTPLLPAVSCKEEIKDIELLLDKDELMPDELKQIMFILGEKEFQIFFQEYLFMSREKFDVEKWKKKINKIDS